MLKLAIEYWCVQLVWLHYLILCFQNGNLKNSRTSYRLIYNIKSFSNNNYWDSLNYGISKNKHTVTAWSTITIGTTSLTTLTDLASSTTMTGMGFASSTILGLFITLKWQPSFGIINIWKLNVFNTSMLPFQLLCFVIRMNYFTAVFHI